MCSRLEIGSAVIPRSASKPGDGRCNSLAIELRSGRQAPVAVHQTSEAPSATARHCFPACRSRDRPHCATARSALHPHPMPQALPSTARPSWRRIARQSDLAVPPHRHQPREGSLQDAARESPAEDCQGHPWDRSRSPGFRRSPPLRASRSPARSCRCRSSPRKQRASSDASTRRAASRT